MEVMETGEAGTMEVKVGAMVEAVRVSATVGEVVEVVEGRVDSLAAGAGSILWRRRRGEGECDGGSGRGGEGGEGGYDGGGGEGECDGGGQ